MDSHGSCFGRSTASARVGSGGGVDLTASGSSASASGRWACRTRLVMASAALRATAFRASPRLRRCGILGSSGDGAPASPPNSSFTPNWLRQSAQFRRYAALEQGHPWSFLRTVRVNMSGRFVQQSTGSASAPQHWRARLWQGQMICGIPCSRSLAASVTSETSCIIATQSWCSVSAKGLGDGRPMGKRQGSRPVPHNKSFKPKPLRGSA